MSHDVAANEKEFREIEFPRIRLSLLAPTEMGKSSEYRGVTLFRCVCLSECDIVLPNLNSDTWYMMLC